MARIGHEFTAQDSAGNIIPSADVEVRLRSDNSFATIYDAETGGLAITQPGFQTDVNGDYEFWVDQGQYNITVGSGASAKTYPFDANEVKITFDTVADLLADPNTYSVGTYVHVKDGDFTYKVVAASGNLGQATAGGVELDVIPSTEGYDVRAFGATGDGTTDDTAEIQAGFDTVKASGGVLIFPVPESQYRITSRIGTDQLVSTDLADNVELRFGFGATVYYDPSPAPAFGDGAIVLEGDNVSITGGLILNSSKTITYASDPIPQRTSTYSGIIIGGKGNRRITETLGYEKSGFLVEGATVTNFNGPITAYAASDGIIRNNTVSDDTDTAILLDNCLSNIEVYGNKVERSFDDCFFARHYYNSPWALAGQYVGDFRVHHNRFTDTFAKSVGFGGIADVQCHDNYFANTWFAASNVEIGGATTWYDNSKNISISRNTIVDAGRNFDPTNTNLPAAQQAEVTDKTTLAGVLLSTTAASYPANTFQNIEIHDNVIINPAVHGVSARYVIGMSIKDNYMYPSRSTIDSVDYDTDGAAIRLQEVVRADIAGNSITTDDTVNFPYCYEVTGSTYTDKIKVGDSPIELFGTSLFLIANATIAEDKFSYFGSNFTAELAYAPGGMADQTVTTVNVALTGARLGDLVETSFSQSLQGLQMSGYVTSTNVITFTFSNLTGGVVSLTAGDARAVVRRKND